MITEARPDTETSEGRTGWSPLPPTQPATGITAWLHRLFWLNLFVEILIVATGGLVRLTASGLGCPDWPQCVPGSLTPVKHQEQSWHKYIEFGNRTMTSVVSIVAVALLVALIVDQRKGSGRRGLWPPVAWILFGIAVQAVVGGISVRTGLNPAIVATHFLASMVLVAASAWLVYRSRETDGPPEPLVPREVRWLGAATAVVVAVVLLLGTLVTGSGPHSGDDAEHPARLSFDVRTVSWLHADTVMLLTGLVIAMLVATLLIARHTRAPKAWGWVAGVIVIQGIVGYTQYFLEVPAGLVEIHMILASLLVVVTTWALLSLRKR
ncbi:MAG TPA: COX15/CtaA family protein [Flexivirga sp.]|uniref:COX15/CtaA family protein n=1 Tax=Flexivirga sp. TaxID=1962927 RepID=UPI002C63C75C|nr:COX15/CtaA family protein [Flexivirga sp.]HWC21854.1 COX15/CtaA family protein [Flexivirga sp.]